MPKKGVRYIYYLKSYYYFGPYKTFLQFNSYFSDNLVCNTFNANLNRYFSIINSVPRKFLVSTAIKEVSSKSYDVPFSYNEYQN